MGWQELRFLHQSGQLIGAHGWSHTLLTHCTERDLDRELGNARLTLEDNLGASVKTMSLPGGRYNQRVLAACRLAGYTQIFSSIPRAEQAASGFLVGRVNVRGDMALEGIGKLLLPGSTMLSRLERQYRIKCAAKTMLGDKLYERVWAVLNRDERQSREDGEYAE
jgi:Polysaccharide deacetylase